MEMEIIEKVFTFENEGREINGVIALPKEEGKYPLVVMNHGFAGSKEEGIGFVSISKALAEKGIAAVRFDFSGCGASIVPLSEFSLTHNMSDSNAVLNYILETENIDKDRLGILGYSMGGRLAIMITNADNNPYKAMTLIAPGAQETMNFTEILGGKVKGDKVVVEFFGQKLELGKEFLDDVLSSNEIMKRATKKIDSIVFSGTKDQLVAPETCKIISSKIKSKLFVLEGADHGYGFFDNPNMNYVNKIVNETVKFFCEKL